MPQISLDVVLGIPGCNLHMGDLDDPMRMGSILQHQDLLTDLVVIKPRQDIDPNHVIYPTDGKTVADKISFKARERKEEKRREEGKRGETHIPRPTTQYVAYQKLTSPPSAPPKGGYHGMARR
jgi:hypothetical protein